MIEKIKRLGTDTAIYGTSTIVGRFLTFLLTPLYANVLLPDQFGIVALTYAYIAFLNVVYGYGMESAYMRYYGEREFRDGKSIFATPFISLAASSSVFSLLLVWQSETVASITHIPPQLVRYAAAILFLDALSIVPFAALRMMRKPVRFASIRIITIAVNVGCNILFLLVMRMGLEGIFLSGVISSAVSVVLLLPTIISHISFRLRKDLHAALLRFGLPYLPAGLATMMVQVIDRPILEALTDQATVGIYQANYRLGIFMMLIVSMYDFAWRPFFLHHAGDADAKPLFARILTYFVLLMSGIFLALSFFIEDIVKAPILYGRSILPEPYWAGLGIVPVVMLAYMCLGVSNNLVAGIHIEKKTGHLPGIAMLGAAINIVTNLLLIPLLGIMGAAIATFLSYFGMMTAMYVVVQRFYPVRYETARIMKIVIAGAVVYLLYLFVPMQEFVLAWKALLLVLFVALMYWMRFFERSELRRISQMLRLGHQGEVPPAQHPPDL
jgi:O-antigen/teichoic acid export membrane protein